MSPQAQHTPGPWFHSDSVLWACVTSKPGGFGEVIASANTPRRFALRAEENTDEEVRANAALIAAAPDLLAALEMIVDWYDGGASPLNLHEQLAAARAALAKARGGK